MNVTVEEGEPPSSRHTAPSPDERRIIAREMLVTASALLHRLERELKLLQRQDGAEVQALADECKRIIAEIRLQMGQIADD